jgi:hypothetical protein
MLITRWVEAEVLRLKRFGLTFGSIAEQIAAVARKQASPLGPLPTGIELPSDFRISDRGCSKAYFRALNREPALEVKQLRRLQTDRCEEQWMHLQPLMRKGNPAAIAAGVKVMAHQAEINGIKPPEELDVGFRDLELERRQEREQQERIVRAMTPAERQIFGELSAQRCNGWNPKWFRKKNGPTSRLRFRGGASTDHSTDQIMG